MSPGFVPAARARGVELMDTGDYVPAELRSNLADLRLYNRWLGGARLVLRELNRMLDERAGAGGAPGALSVLDVGTGSADIPLAIQRWAARRGITAGVEGVDANAEMLAEARLFLSREHNARVRLRQADACMLPHADGSVEYIVSSNFMHHLDDTEALAALREMGRVAARGGIVVDLQRRDSALFNVWMLTRLTTRNRLTRSDGPLSVRRAFTVDEMAKLAREAGLAGARVRSAGPVRMVLTWSQ